MCAATLQYAVSAMAHQALSQPVSRHCYKTCYDKCYLLRPCCGYGELLNSLTAHWQQPMLLAWCYADMRAVLHALQDGIRGSG